MKSVKVLANGAAVEFECNDIELRISTEEHNYGQLVAYDIDPLNTSVVYLNPASIDAVVVTDHDAEATPRKVKPPRQSRRQPAQQVRH